MPDAETAAVLGALSERGLLLKQDRVLPSVVGVVTGEALRTSWWTHPKARVIFRVLAEAKDHPDVLFVKLVAGKDTLVHRRLWPAFLAVANAREEWQTRGLTAEARLVWDHARRSRAPIRTSGRAARELQLRLLVHAEAVHTESGRHEQVLEAWKTWAKRVGAGVAMSPAGGREALEAAARALGAADRLLPWRRGSAARYRRGSRR